MTTLLRFEPHERSTPRRTTVAELMTQPVHACTTGDTLDRAARLLWEHDCGAVPVLAPRGEVVAMVTDRDICMAAYIQGRPLWQIPVTVAASRRVHCVRSDAPLAEALHLMRMHRVRRLPVVDFGHNLVGILSLADVVRAARISVDPHDPLSVETIADLLSSICRPSR